MFPVRNIRSAPINSSGARRTKELAVEGGIKYGMLPHNEIKKLLELLALTLSCQD